MFGLIHGRAMGELATLRARARVPFEFRVLHAVGVLLTLPVFAAARLVPRRGGRRDESVFAETNRSVLTALGIAFTA